MRRTKTRADKKDQSRSRPSPSDKPQYLLKRGLNLIWHAHSCTYAWKTDVPNVWLSGGKGWRYNVDQRWSAHMAIKIEWHEMDLPLWYGHLSDIQCHKAHLCASQDRLIEVFWGLTQENIVYNLKSSVLDMKDLWCSGHLLFATSVDIDKVKCDIVTTSTCKQTCVVTSIQRLAIVNVVGSCMKIRTCGLRL